MAVAPYRPKVFVPVVRAYRRFSSPIIRLGHMLVFFFRALAGIPIALRHYRSEFVRLLSDRAQRYGANWAASLTPPGAFFSSIRTASCLART